MHGAQSWAAFLAALWVLWALLIRWLAGPGIRGGELVPNFLLRLIHVYARLMHRLGVLGGENAPERDLDGFGERPLVVVANHTAGIDPLLIQASLPFEVRWMMAEDMRVGWMEPLWKRARIIFVDRREGESIGLREALRHLKAGGTLGVFPEGVIERPARRLLPFREGVGLLIGRTRALVLPVVIEGTPQVDPAWASLTRPSRSSVRFLPLIDFAARKTPPGEIAASLREVYARATGWALNETKAIYENGKWWYVDPAGNRTPAEEHESRE